MRPVEELLLDTGNRSWKATLGGQRAGKARAMGDPLGDVLRMVRLSGGVFLSAELAAPWSVTAAISAQECLAFDLEPRQLVAYHYIVAGHVYIAIGQQSPTRVSAGEIVMLPQNDQHIVSSAPHLPPMPGKLVIPPPVDGVSRLKFGGAGETCHLLCGFLSSEDFNPLLVTLPKLLTINVAAMGNASWIESSMRFAIAELARGHPASSNVMSRLSELLFIEAVRSYATNMSVENDLSWLRGISDPQIGRVLALMHRSPSTELTVDTLAREPAPCRRRKNSGWPSIRARSALPWPMRRELRAPPAPCIGRWNSQM